MQVTSKSTGVKKAYGPITVDKVEPGLNPKKHQAQIRQVITNIYPGTRASNSLNDSLFSEEEFGAEAQSFEENRVAFLPIPVGTTVEHVQARLAGLPNARIIRILRLQPILSDEQKKAMETGLSKKTNGELKTLEDYVEQQTVRSSEGEVILYKGKLQFKVNSFMDGKSGPVDDIDLREEDLLDLNPIHMTDHQLEATKAEQAKAKF